MKGILLKLIRVVGERWCRIHGVQLGKDVLVHGLPVIRRKKKGSILLGDRVTLNVAKWSNPLNDGRATVMYAGEGASIVIGNDAGLSSARIIASQEITVGEGALIGAGCLICDSDMHEIPLKSSNPIRSAPIRIGREVFLGTGCIVLKGITIGDRAVVGAGSVVARDIPADCVAVGNPARPLSRGLGAEGRN